MLTHAWNTGRGYSADGQVIAAKVLDGTRIVFNDMSRGIWGVIKSDTVKFDKMPDSFRLNAFKGFVMQEYDAYRYQGPSDIEEMNAVNELGKFDGLSLNKSPLSQKDISKMARKSSKVAVETVVSEIEVSNVAADTVAATLTGTRTALDASDPIYDPTYEPATPITVYDPTYEPATPHIIVPMGGTVEDVPVDPMAPYADRTVKMAYLIDGLELDMNRLFKGCDASVEAHNRANDRSGPRVPVIIRDANTGQELATVHPMNGTRAVKIIPGTRPAATRTVKAGASAEDLAVEAWLKDYAAATKENDRRDREYDAAYDAAHKENVRIDKERDKAETEKAKKLAIAAKKLRRHPAMDTDAYQDYLLLTREQGATCKEMNHYRNVRLGVTNSNKGWRQVADGFEDKYGLLLIGQGRQCEVSDKRGLSEAMRLIDRNDKVPANWINISKLYDSLHVEQSED